MTPEHERRIRAACEALADALIDAAQAAERPADVERLLGIPEACARLGIGRSRLFAEINANRLRSVKVGRRRLIPASAIAELVA